MLVVALINKGILTTDTVVTASISSVNKFGMIKSRSDEYVLKDIKRSQDGYRLSLCDLIGKQEINVTDAEIVGIDGMTLARYAEVYNINADGTSRSIGRKRGRKPKIRQSG